MTITATNITVQIVLTWLLVAWYLYPKKKEDCWKYSLRITAVFVLGVFLCFFGVGGVIIAVLSNIALATFVFEVTDIMEAVTFVGYLVLGEAILFGLISALL